MLSTKLRGYALRHETPGWDPLLRLAASHIDDFMWMFEVECDDGTRLHAYKHRCTRRYLHLDGDGRAFVYRGDSCYREVDPVELLDCVLA